MFTAIVTANIHKSGLAYSIECGCGQVQNKCSNNMLLAAVYKDFSQPSKTVNWLQRIMMTDLHINTATTK